MRYCWKCCAEIDEGIAYCPKCGTATNQPHYPPSGDRDKSTRPLGVVLTVLSVVVGVTIIILGLFALGFLPGIESPFGHIGSGQLQTQQYNLTDFAAVSAGDGFNVQITQGSTYSIQVTTDDNIMQYVDVHKDGSALVVELQPGGYQTNQLKAEITLPDLTNLQLSGGSVAEAQNFNVSSDLEADLSGGSRVTLSGQAADLIVSGSGGSNINFIDLQANNAMIDLSGGSQCRVNLSGTLDATLSGGSQLHYKGNPTLGDIDTSGGSSIFPIT